MQAIPGGIKALVILISNEIPDEDTDQNTTQPPYRLTTCFSEKSSLSPEQSIRDASKTEIFSRRAMVNQAVGLCYRKEM